MQKYKTISFSKRKQSGQQDNLRILTLLVIPLPCSDGADRQVKIQLRTKHTLW